MGEVPNGGLEQSWKAVVLELDDVLHRPTGALDLSLRPRVVRPLTGVHHASLGEIPTQLLRHLLSFA